MARWEGEGRRRWDDPQAPGWLEDVAALIAAALLIAILILSAPR